MLLTALTVAAAAAVSLIAAYFSMVVLYGLYAHWKAARVAKGPPSNLILGHLPEVQKQGRDLYLVAHDFIPRYGKVFPVWIAQRCFIWVADFKMVQQIAVKRFASFPERPVFMAVALPNKAHKAMTKELVYAHSLLWSSVRAAIQPLFHTQSLSNCTLLINNTAVELRTYFLQHTTAPSLDVWRPCGALTLDVIGRISLGCELGAIDHLLSNGGTPPYLVSAAEENFGSLALVAPTTFVQLLGPPGFLDGLWKWLAVNVFDVQAARVAIRGRARMYDVALQLYRNALKRQSGDGNAPGLDNNSWIFWDDSMVKDNPYKDLVPTEGSLPDMLAKARSKADERGLSELEIVANIYEMLATGYETTANTLAYTIYLISLHKSVETKLLEEIDAFGRKREVSLSDLDSLPYLDAVVRESLRMYPVGPFTIREAAEDIEIDGVLFPKGTGITLALYSMLHDPEVFAEPDKYKPERWMTDDATIKAMAGLAFGIGPRNCIGYKLALLEVKITLVRLYQELTFDVDMDRHAKGLKTAHRVTLQPVEGVHCRVKRRAHAK